MKDLVAELQYYKILINSNYGISGKTTYMDYYDRALDIKRRINLIESRKFKIKKIFNG
jgi:hypothetical protein